MFSFQHLTDALLAVADAHFDAKLAVKVLRQMLGAVNTAVLSARATEGEHERGEAALDIALHVGIG